MQPSGLTGWGVAPHVGGDEMRADSAFEDIDGYHPR
jgi:hypothetical protein